MAGHTAAAQISLPSKTETVPKHDWQITEPSSITMAPTMYYVWFS